MNRSYLLKLIGLIMKNNKLSLAVVASHSIGKDLVRIVKSLTYVMGDYVQESAQSNSNDSLFELMDNHCSNLEGDVRGNISSDDLNGLQKYISGEYLDLAYESIKGLSIVDKDSWLSTIISESQQRAYEDIVFENFKLFLQALHEELVEHLICDELSENDGELPKDFDYLKVIDELFAKHEYIDTSSFEFGDQ